MTDNTKLHPSQAGTKAYDNPGFILVSGSENPLTKGTQVTVEEKQALLGTDLLRTPSFVYMSVSASAGDVFILSPIEDMTARDDVGICSEHRDPPDHMLWQDNNGRWHEFHGARKPTLAEVEASADVVLIDRESGRPKQVRPVAIRWPNGDEWSK